MKDLVRRLRRQRTGALWSALLVVTALALSAPAVSQNRPTEAGQPGGAAKAGATGQPKGGTAKEKDKRGSRRAAAQDVIVDAVIIGPVIETAPVYGRLVAQQTGVVASRTRGAVGHVYVQVGDRIQRGDPLISLVTDTLRAERALREAELREFTAKIETADAQAKLAEQELSRLNQLRDSSAYSPARYQDKLRDVERFRSAKVEAIAKAEQARAQLSMADINLGYAEIKAPYDGVVSQRHVELGVYVNVGDKVVTLINDTELEVEAEVPTSRLGGLTPGRTVEVQPDYGDTFRAEVRAIVPEENPLARTRTVRFVPRVDERAAGLAANQSVVLQVPTGAPRDAVSVHKDSIVQRRGEPVVFVIANNRAQMRSVALGPAVGGRFEVLSGLKPGDSVVIRGNERLNDGQAVTIRAADPVGGSGGEATGNPGASTNGQGGT